jgi:carboxylesterase
VVPAADSARVLGRVSSTDVTEILLEQSHHVATLDHDADRIFEESHAFVTRLVTEAVKESGAESVQQSGSGPAEQFGAGSLEQREGTATGG